MTCEENWAGYFASRDSDLPRELSRYGLRSSSRYGWDHLTGDEFERFDATRITTTASADYRNEPNHFGWIVEIDPFAPESVPVKRTALGRFAHEGLVSGTQCIGSQPQFAGHLCRVRAQRTGWQG